MRTSFLFAIPFALAVAGCGDDTTTPMPDLAMVQPDLTMMQDPVKPALSGTQIERMGRATINVAVTNPFDLDYTAVGGGANRDATRDMHSKDSDPAGWRAKWTPIHARTLAIYDGADTTCGNQVGACGRASGCTMADPVDNMRYVTLGGLFADDRLYLNTTKMTCNAYLAVEASALGVPYDDCGGRTPLYDVVDFMYTGATVGLAGLAMNPLPVNDGVPKDEETTDSLTDFPFLSAPN